MSLTQVVAFKGILFVIASQAEKFEDAAVSPHATEIGSWLSMRLKKYGTFLNVHLSSCASCDGKQCHALPSVYPHPRRSYRKSFLGILMS